MAVAAGDNVAGALVGPSPAGLPAVDDPGRQEAGNAADSRRMGFISYGHAGVAKRTCAALRAARAPGHELGGIYSHSERLAEESTSR